MFPSGALVRRPEARATEGILKRPMVLGSENTAVTRSPACTPGVHSPAERKRGTQRPTGGDEGCPPTLEAVGAMGGKQCQCAPLPEHSRLPPPSG